MSKITIQNLEVQELISEVDATELSQIQGGNIDLVGIGKEIDTLINQISSLLK